MKSKPVTIQKCTVYYDGSCPICSKEIALYQAWRGGEHMNWVDASQCEQEALGADLTRAQALARLHCRDQAGNLIDGARAFVTIWSHLRWLSYLSPILSNSLVLRGLEFFYTCFLKLRKQISTRRQNFNS